jgi:hypothetical protein
MKTQQLIDIITIQHTDGFGTPEMDLSGRLRIPASGGILHIAAE